MIETTSFTLPNGLRVVHNYDDTTAMVALDVLYNVGARDERPDRTGMAHLFEHLMFGGSVNIADFDGELQRAGGTNNAWTNNDFTNFYEVLPAVNAETAFWLESDRMLGLAFSDKALDVQRHVVIEEFKQTCLNQPYGDMAHHLDSLLYTQHPYSYPTIGKEISHIEAVTGQDIRDFFYNHYAPNNAVLAVSGAITLDETRRLCDKWFGSIPSRDIAPRLYLPEPPVDAPRRRRVYADVPQTVLTIGVHMCDYNHPDYPVADIISDILGSGQASRLYREVVAGSDLFTGADAAITGSNEPGCMLITGKLSRDDDESVAEAEELLWQQMERLVNENVSQYELTRALNRFESTYEFGAINVLSKASSMAMCAMNGEDINGVVARYRSMTTDDVRRVASGLFRRQRSCTLVYGPNSEERKLQL